MSDSGPKRFDQILKNAEDDSQVFISGGVCIVIGTLIAVGEYPSGDSGSLWGWSWKVALAAVILIPVTLHAWKTAKFALLKRYKEAGAFMRAALKERVVEQMPFRHLWCMRDIARAEQLSQKAAVSAVSGRGVMLVFADASGEEIFCHTRIKCAKCGHSLDPWLAANLWKEREIRQGDDLDPAGRCRKCGGETGIFETSLAGLDGPSS